MTAEDESRLPKPRTCVELRECAEKFKAAACAADSSPRDMSATIVPPAVSEDGEDLGWASVPRREVGGGEHDQMVDERGTDRVVVGPGNGDPGAIPAVSSRLSTALRTGGRVVIRAGHSRPAQSPERASRPAGLPRPAAARSGRIYRSCADHGEGLLCPPGNPG